MIGDKEIPEMMKLEKIIGLSTLNNTSIATVPCSSDIFYAAGSCVVRYNVDENIQKSFYKASKAVSSLTVSADGKYLAVGERGHYPGIIVWDVHSGEVISTISGSHKHGIGCLTFSPDSRYLVSAGFKHDRQLIVWDWESEKKMSVQKLGNKVNAIHFHPDGSFFVTCGDRHLKWWYITFGNEDLESINVTGKPASILESHKNAVFMDVKIGVGCFVYCTTSTGLLCAFNETRFMDTWVQLESSASYSLSLLENENDNDEDMVIVGCTEGLVRVFSAKSLQYLSTLPLPVPSVGYTNKFPACLALCIIAGGTDRTTATSKSPKLAAIYADRNFFVWDIDDIYNATQFRSFSFHRACIWDVQFLNNSSSGDDVFPPGTFVTCSADNSIRIWNDDPKSYRLNKVAGHNPEALYGEILQVIELESQENHDSIPKFSSSLSSSTIDEEATNLTDSPINLSTGIPDTELPDRPQTAVAPRALAIHPSGQQLVCGDRSGLLRVFDLATTSELKSIQAHSAEVLTLHYSPPLRPVGDGTWTADFLDPTQENEDGGDDNEPSLVLLASAGRDRLVHIFNASDNNYTPISTLDSHSSSVTVVKFTPDGKRLLSCGGDRTMVFNSVNGTDITRIKSVQTPHGTINGLAVEATNKFAVTSGQDRRLNIWNLQSGKHMRAYKNDAVTGELYKSDIDPSGTFVAACAFDKTINLFDFFSGDLVAQVSGHSEAITAVRFSPDGRYLLSVGGDGCIMIWSLANSLVSAMQERLMELSSSAKKRIVKLESASNHEKETPKVMPPPPPDQRVGTGNDLPVPPPSQVPRASTENVPVTNGITIPTKGDDIRSSDASAGRGKWASRIEQQGGYELFGRKINSAAAAERNKFTLEFTHGVDISSIGHVGDDDDESQILMPDQDLVSRPLIEEDGDNNDMDFENENEEGRNYIVGAAGAIEDQGSKNDLLSDSLSSQFFKDLKLSEQAPSSGDSPNRESKAKAGNDSGLSPSKSSTLPSRSPSHNTVDILKERKKSNFDLLDTNLSVSSTSNSIILEEKRKTTSAAVAHMKERLRSMGVLGGTLSGREEILVPPIPPSSSSINTITENITAVRESKQEYERENTPLKQEKQVNSTESVLKIEECVGNDEEDSEDYGSLEQSMLSEVSPAKHAPPSYVEENIDGEEGKAIELVLPDVDDADVSLAAGGDDSFFFEAELEVSIALPLPGEKADISAKISDFSDEEKRVREFYLDQELQLRTKAAACKDIISELTRAKQAALASFNELAQLRASLDQTLTSSTFLSQSVALRESVNYQPKGNLRSEVGGSELFHPRRDALDSTSNILNTGNNGSVVIAEVDALMNEFRQSFMISPEFPSDGILDVNASSATLGSLSSQVQTNSSQKHGDSFRLIRSLNESMKGDQRDNIDEGEMFSFLDKYSDRLVEMVTNKVKAKESLVDK